MTDQQVDVLMEQLRRAQREIGRMSQTLDQLTRSLRPGHRPPAAPAGPPRTAPARPGGPGPSSSTRPEGAPRGGWDSR